MHFSPSHSALPFGEFGQTVQDFPQAVGLVAGTQIPAQGFFPAGQVGSHAPAVSAQALPHGLLPVGHLIAQAPLSQVAIPSWMVGQGSQALPQVRGSLLSTQPLLQR
jgi:hypothetical protein